MGQEAVTRRKMRARYFKSRDIVLLMHQDAQKWRCRAKFVFMKCLGPPQQHRYGNRIAAAHECYQYLLGFHGDYNATFNMPSMSRMQKASAYAHGASGMPHRRNSDAGRLFDSARSRRFHYR